MILAAGESTEDVQRTGFPDSLAVGQGFLRKMMACANGLEAGHDRLGGEGGRRFLRHPLGDLTCPLQGGK